MMSCASCGETIPPSESDLPCPCCGCADRNLALADYGAAVDEVRELDAQFPRAPAAWQQMWAEVQHNLGVLRRWYSGGQGMNVTELRADSLAFFVSCYHLKEHIKEDPAVPWPARDQVSSHVRNIPSLQLAADIANTYKHSKRNSGRACGIDKASTRPTGSTVTFAWTDAQGRSCSADCLDLAEQAVDAWGDFLRSHHLLAP
jgi:hypothetical protein